MAGMDDRLTARPLTHLWRRLEDGDWELVDEAKPTHSYNCMMVVYDMAVFSAPDDLFVLTDGRKPPIEEKYVH